MKCTWDRNEAVAHWHLETCTVRLCATCLREWTERASTAPTVLSPREVTPIRSPRPE